LLKAKEEGKIRWIGVTGHSRPVILKAIYSEKFDTIQIPFNPIEDEWLEDVIPAARERSMGIIGMKPLAGGALRNAAESIRFSILKGTDVAIPGMDSVEQVEKNAGVGEELRELDAEETEKLEEEKGTWEGRFCRRCGYCMPCPNGLNIPFLLLIDAYYTRYGLKDWALARLNTLDKKFADCTECGECLDKCPYQLPIPEMMKEAAERVI
ncbi:aldo/keto reductase, partial [bacterium]